jgi:hypothetical protein
VLSGFLANYGCSPEIQSGEMPIGQDPASGRKILENTNMATVTLFPDESGYTGPDLINRNQPFFTLASTNLSEADARSLLITSCFGAGTQEVKFVKLAKSERGRAAIRIYHLSKLAVPFFSRLRHRLALR